MRNNWKDIKNNNELKVKNNQLNAKLNEMYAEHRKLEDIINELHTQISDEKDLNKVLSEKFRDINIENKNLKSEVKELEDCVKDANKNMFDRILEVEKLKRELNRSEITSKRHLQMCLDLSEKLDEMTEKVERDAVDKVVSNPFLYWSIIVLLMSISAYLIFKM